MAMYQGSKMETTLVDVNEMKAILNSRKHLPLWVYVYLCVDERDRNQESNGYLFWKRAGTILIPKSHYRQHENHISLLNKIQEISRKLLISPSIQLLNKKLKQNKENNKNCSLGENSEIFSLCLYNM